MVFRSTNVSKTKLCIATLCIALIFSLNASAERMMWPTKEDCLRDVPSDNGKTINSMSIFNPCDKRSGYFVWGQSVTKSYDCIETKAGWQYYTSMQNTVKRTIYTSSGPNQFGIVLCSSMPYEKSNSVITTTAKATYYPVNGGIDITYKNVTSTQYTQVIEAPNSPAFVRAYGIPKFWDASQISVVNSPGVSPAPVWYDYPVSTVEYDWMFHP